MRNRTIAALLVVSIIASTVAGYFVGLTTQSNQANPGRCTPSGSLQGPIPAGVNVAVSYQGNWRLSIAEFDSNRTTASALHYVCYYDGSGTTSFYVSYANYQGWNTIFALAHKYGTSGTLTVTAAVPSISSSNSTASSYGDASTSISFLIRSP